ncbi:MAG: response regulator transcription factor [Chloroflexales bacterium]|nr:response regulator transcription factor [Chloroflexales bacterium]
MFKSRTVPTETPRQIHDAMARGEIVLIDVRMPRLDGIEATRQIKGCWPKIRVIVLTLHPIYRAAALAAGADAFVVKGCSRDDLIQTLRGP